MQNDFVPVHLKEANARLDKHVLAAKEKQGCYTIIEDKSLWEKFLGFFKR